MSFLFVKIFQHIDFYARRNGHGERHHKKSTKYLAGEDGNGCNVNQNKEIHLNLEVPSIPPTDCTTSNIIAVKYYIEVSRQNVTLLFDDFFQLKHFIIVLNGIFFVAKVEAIAEGCCSGNLKASFPITIGTYPIQDNIMTQPMATQILPTEPHFQPTAPVMPPDSSGSMKMPLPDQPNDPTAPPSYDLETALNNGKTQTNHLDWLQFHKISLFFFQILQLMQKQRVATLRRKVTSNQSIQCSSVKRLIQAEVNRRELQLPRKYAQFSSK